MPAALLPDKLWEVTEPFIPTPRARPKGGRPRLADRACLAGIVFVLQQWCSLGNAAPRTGVRIWHDLLAALARLAGSGNLAVDPLRAPGLARSFPEN
jgi:hypothetical protein